MTHIPRPSRTRPIVARMVVLVLLLAVGRRPLSWVFKALVIVGIMSTPLAR